MNLELKNLVEWMYANKLSLNVAKTHFLIFRSKGMSDPKPIEILSINQQVIMRENKTKFLGVIIDDRLSWESHIHYIKSKISKGIGIICKVRNILNESILVNLYNCFVYPYINYAIEIWGDTHNCFVNSIYKLQKKALRIISRSGSRDHTDPLFIKYKIMNVHKVHEFKVCITMFKVYQKDVPAVFSDLFKLNRDIHSYNTRQSNNLHVPISNTNYMMRSISVKGVRIWNKYHEQINPDCSPLCLKAHLKRIMIPAVDI